MKNIDDEIPPWVHWLAQDADGTWWGFEAEPNEGDHSWYENEVGRYCKLGLESANLQWRHSLRRRSVD